MVSIRVKARQGIVIGENVVVEIVCRQGREFVVHVRKPDGTTVRRESDIDPRMLEANGVR